MDKSEGMEEDTLLGEDREEGVVGIVKKGGGEETAGDGDERWRDPLCKSSKTVRKSHLSDRIGVNVDVVQTFITLEELLPQRGKMKSKLVRKRNAILS